jgi:hypothetical protein
MNKIALALISTVFAAGTALAQTPATTTAAPAVAMPAAHTEVKAEAKVAVPEVKAADTKVTPKSHKKAKADKKAAAEVKADVKAEAAPAAPAAPAAAK